MCGWSGHGDSYPWEADKPFLGVVDSGESGQVSPPPGSNASKLAITTRYLTSKALFRDLS